MKLSRLREIKQSETRENCFFIFGTKRRKYVEQLIKLSTNSGWMRRVFAERALFVSSCSRHRRVFSETRSFVFIFLASHVHRYRAVGNNMVYTAPETYFLIQLRKYYKSLTSIRREKNKTKLRIERELLRFSYLRGTRRKLIRTVYRIFSYAYVRVHISYIFPTKNKTNSR